MPETVTTHGWPIPTLPDPPNLPAAFSDFADAVGVDLSATLTSLVPRLRVTEVTGAVSGSPPDPATTTFDVKLGHGVYTTDTNGRFTIPFATAFPTGLVFCLALNGGDQDIRIVFTPGAPVGLGTRTSVTFGAANMSGAIVSSPVRVTWIAVGW